MPTGPNPKIKKSIWNPCVALQLNVNCWSCPSTSRLYGGVGIEVLNLLEEVAEYVSESSREHPNSEGTLRYYRREIACASQKVTMKLMVARLDLVRARSNQHRHHWTNNVDLTNYLQEESNDERQYGT